jgi:hypothetical protein
VTAPSVASYTLWLVVKGLIERGVSLPMGGALTNIAVVTGRTAKSTWLVRAFASKLAAAVYVEALHAVQLDYGHATADAGTEEALLTATKAARARLWALGERSAHPIMSLDWDVVEVPLVAP